jgi:hypothetical protein
MRLAELQQSVQAFLLAGGEPPPELVAAVRPPATARWRIYSDAYRIRLVDALAKGFPALAGRLGAPTFGALLLDFVAAQPSVHRSIRDYGAELEAWLRTEAADASGPELAMLADLAAFEWALAGAYDAADAAPVTHAELAALAPDDWAGLRFAPAPCVRRVVVSTNAVAVRHAVLRDVATGAAEPTTAVDAADARGPAAARGDPTTWLIWRDRLDVRFRSLAPDEAVALDRCFAGAAFGELCVELERDHGELAPVQAATWLKGWTADGLLVHA